MHFRSNPPVLHLRASLGCRRAFTLIELLAASAITVVLAGLMLMMAVHVSELWQRISGRLGAEAQARLVLDQLTLDIQGAQYRDNLGGTVWLAADILTSIDNAPGLWSRGPVGGRFIPSPKPVNRTHAADDEGNSLDVTALRRSLPEKGRLADARFGVGGVWLRFFTTSRGANRHTDPSTISAPVAVAYQVIRRCPASDESPGAVHRYYLHRTEVRPAAAVVKGMVRPGTLEMGYNIVDVGYEGPTDDSWGGNDGMEAGDPYAIRCPQCVDTRFAENVIDFGLWLHGRRPGPDGRVATLQRIFPADADHLAHRASAAPATADPGTVFPEVADVMIRVLTDEGAHRVALLESGRLQRPAHYASNEEWWWGVAEQNSVVLTKRIHLPAFLP
ncbi:MAG: prepilin-type N-terminal cleavage/methylation domain-containing protein [Opitutaceae bacterium]|nr:prepilin-type N-terminal cleavage/methylation domain-containing protein [Opitutaceae bacterium]